MKAKLTLISLALAASFLAVPTSSEAQTIRRFPTNAGGGWYRPPGTTVWMFPAPTYGYQIGGTRIYPGRPTWNWYQSPVLSNWPYGYPNSYTWPYGNRYSRRSGR